MGLNVMRSWKEVFTEERERYDGYLKRFQGSSYFLNADNLELFEAELYCEAFDSFVDGGLQRYEQIAKMCKANGIVKVFDIGCNVALHAKVFKEYGISYTGVEMFKEFVSLSPQGDEISYIHGIYPFGIEVDDKAHTAAVSELCVGYQASGEKVWEQLAKDFDYFAGLPGPGKNGEDTDFFKKMFHLVDMVTMEGLPCYFAVNQRVRNKSVSLDIEECVVESYQRNKCFVDKNL